MPETFEFWRALASAHNDLSYVDYQFLVLRGNGYTQPSNADMYAAWRDAGKPDLEDIDV